LGDVRKGPLFFAGHKHRCTKLAGGCAENRENFRVHFSQIQSPSHVYENIKEKPGLMAGRNFNGYSLSQNFCPRRDGPSGLEEFFDCSLIFRLLSHVVHFHK
jgi:hypothetical protein